MWFNSIVAMAMALMASRFKQGQIPTLGFMGVPLPLFRFLYSNRTWGACHPRAAFLVPVYFLCFVHYFGIIHTPDMGFAH